jgi:hypothetical protein
MREIIKPDEGAREGKLGCAGTETRMQKRQIGERRSGEEAGMEMSLL